MAEAVGVAEDRDLGRFLDVADQLVGAAGDDEVDIAVLGEQAGNGVAGGDELYGAEWHLCLFEGRGDDAGDGDE